MANPPSRPSTRGGCLPIAWTCLGTCALLALNSLLVNALLDPVLGAFPVWFRRPKLEQSLLFVLPVLATVVQWWVMDWILYQSRDRSPGSRDSERNTRIRSRTDS